VPYRRDLGECSLRKSRLAVLTVGVSLLVAGLLASPSIAAAKSTDVTIRLTAVVYDVNNPNGLPLGIQPGEEISGSYTYNPQTKDADSRVAFGFYPHTQQPYGIQLNMGGFSVQTDAANVDFQITISNNDDSGSDNHAVVSFNNISNEGGPGCDIIAWHLADPTHTALSNAVLKKTAPVVSSWQSSELEVTGPDEIYRIRAHVTQAVVA
jgi:hypothetical protein